MIFVDDRVETIAPPQQAVRATEVDRNVFDLGLATEVLRRRDAIQTTALRTRIEASLRVRRQRHPRTEVTRHVEHAHDRRLLRRGIDFPIDGRHLRRIGVGIGAEGMGTVFLAWVSWSWLANLGVITALVLLLAGPRMVRKIRWLLEIIAWLSVLLAALGAFVVLGWGEEPLLFGPAYWAWLAALVVMGIGVSLTPHGQRQPDVTGEQ